MAHKLKFTSKKAWFIFTFLGATILLSTTFIASQLTYITAQQQQQEQDREMIMNSSMMERGNIVMGFNQNRIMHHFIATSTGGEIMIVALNNRDSNTIKQIRDHVVDIQKDFSEGNFTKPFYIHSQQVPGTKLMTERKDMIRYDIKQINNGSILLLTTNDQQLISAIHQFIAFQSSQHVGH